MRTVRSVDKHGERSTPRKNARKRIRRMRRYIGLTFLEDDFL